MIAVFEHWVMESQVQVINQQIDKDSRHDAITKVSFASQDYWTGRLGARLNPRAQALRNRPVGSQCSARPDDEATRAHHRVARHVGTSHGERTTTV